MTNKLEKLSYDWSLIDGQGLVCVVPIATYKTGFVLVAHIGVLADKHDYYPDMTLSREKVTITIDDEDEAKAYALASEIDKTILAHVADASGV